MLGGMVTGDTNCAKCGGGVGEYIDPECDPELCECCDEVLCWRCWSDTHMVYFY